METNLNLSKPSEKFVSRLISSTYTGVGIILCRPMYDSNSLLITFINCPEGRRGGADGENNLTKIIVEGFERPDGKVKMSVLVRSHRTDKKLRGKTGKIESVLKTVSEHIEMLAHIEPYYVCDR